MAARKQYPLRIDPEVWGAVEAWASDEMRSANAQVEWILRQALRDAGRLPGASRARRAQNRDEASTPPSE